MTVVDRFLQYVKFDTQSDELTNMTPSTPGQMIFAQHLEKELREMGLSDISLDDNGYLMATLPGNTGRKDVPTVGFIAHLDTSPDMSGRHVSPRIVENYDGGDITLNAEKGIVLSPSEFPELKNYIGQPLIVTDGNTLLGADDKAGIAEIITAVAYLKAHPEIEHGDIRIAFNPDEEIGQGAHKFDVERFGADWAYTMDGGEIGELEYENFNAAVAKVTICGRNVHPGYAKHKMINSLLTRKINNEFPGVATLEIKDQYYNMREKIEPVMHIIDIALQAMKDAGVEPKVVPIRGGTDGAQLSFKGLPCPNIFAGGLNFHGRYEFVPVPSMEKATQVIVEIARLVAKQ